MNTLFLSSTRIIVQSPDSPLALSLSLFKRDADADGDGVIVARSCYSY